MTGRRNGTPRRRRLRLPRHPKTVLVTVRLDQIRTAAALSLFTPPGQRAALVAIDRMLELPDHKLSDLVLGHSAPTTDLLFHTLDGLGRDAAGFLAEALGPGQVDAIRMLEEIEVEHREDVDLLADLPGIALPAPNDNQGVVSPELEERLLRLDERRFVDPQGALPVARELWRELVAASAADPSRATVERLCRCLGAMGSMAGSLAGGFGAAARCLRQALEHAQRHRLAGAEADLLQRLAYLLSHKGRRQAAAIVAQAARDEHFLAGDRAGEGRASVTLGLMLQRAGRQEEAARWLRAGLRELPSWIWWGCEAAHEHLALVALAAGETLEAERELGRAFEAAGEHAAQRLHRLAWIGGEVALARGQNEEAVEQLLRARGQMGSRHPLEDGLLALRLAIAYLRLGRLADLNRLAGDLVGLLKPLAREPLAVETLTEVARAVMAGEVKERLLQRAAERLWRGYARLEEYPLRPPAG